MNSLTLSAADVAAHFGRSLDWLYANHKRLAREQGMPKPISGGGKGGELTWSSIQFYVWLDRDLPPDLRVMASAMRAAIIAARTQPAQQAAASEVDKWRQKLNERFGQ